MDQPGRAIGLDGFWAVDTKAAAAGWILAFKLNGSDIDDHVTDLSKLALCWALGHHEKFLCGTEPDRPEVDIVKHLVGCGYCWFKFSESYEPSLSGGPGTAAVA